MKRKLRAVLRQEGVFKRHNPANQINPVLPALLHQGRHIRHQLLCGAKL